SMSLSIFTKSSAKLKLSKFIIWFGRVIHLEEQLQGRIDL
ncbi:20172_t:CDS:1, partial [Funneliformis geosporum]